MKFLKRGSLFSTMDWYRFILQSEAGIVL